MDKDTMHKIALAIIASEKKKIKETDPVDENAIVTGEEALERVKNAARKDWLKTMCGSGELDITRLVKIPEENYKQTESLENKAKSLGIPLNEYLNFCEELKRNL